MSWNYRIVKRYYTDLRSGEERSFYALHEVYYDEDGNPNARTVEPISFQCDEEEGPEGIQGSLKIALDDATKHPVLDDKELKKTCHRLDD